MKELTKQELIEVEGGSIFAKIGLVVAGVAFIIGLFDGIFRPLRCN